MQTIGTIEPGNPKHHNTKHRRSTNQLHRNGDNTMFQLQPKPTFKSDVTIVTPGGGEGKIKFEFKHMGRKALKAFFESLGEGEGARQDNDALLDIIQGWEGVDEKFSPEALDTLLDNYPSAAKAIFEAYNRGLFEGKQKN